MNIFCGPTYYWHTEPDIFLVGVSLVATNNIPPPELQPLKTSRVWLLLSDCDGSPLPLRCCALLLTGDWRCPIAVFDVWKIKRWPSKLNNWEQWEISSKASSIVLLLLPLKFTSSHLPALTVWTVWTVRHNQNIIDLTAITTSHIYGV